MAIEAPTTDDAVESLACGRDAATAWDRAEAGIEPDAHERDCPYCRAAFADADQLDTAVHRLAAEPVEAPSSVVDAVMRSVRTELRPQETLALDSPFGPNQLAHAAAASVLRAVVDATGLLRARSCRIEQPGYGTPATVTLTVAARFGVDLAAVTAEARRLVLAAGEQALGLPMLRVDIEVVDLWAAP